MHRRSCHRQRVQRRHVGRSHRLRGVGMGEVKIRKTREPATSDDFYPQRPWTVRSGQVTFFFRNFDEALHFVNGWGR